MVAAFQLGMIGWLVAGAIPIILLNQQHEKITAVDDGFRTPWGGGKSNSAQAPPPIFKLPSRKSRKKYLHGAAWLIPSVLSMNFHTVKSTSLAMIGIRVLFLEMARRGKANAGISLPAIAALVVPAKPGEKQKQIMPDGMERTALAEEDDEGKWWITKKLVGKRKRPQPASKQTKWSLTSTLMSPNRKLVVGRKPNTIKHTQGRTMIMPSIPGRQEQQQQPQYSH